MNDYGTKLRFKCHQRIKRKEKSIDGESCTNWELIDSFGIGLDLDHVNIGYADEHKNFYADPEPWWFEQFSKEVLYVNIYF